MKRLVPGLAALLVRAIAASLRVNITDRGGIVDYPDHAPVIVAFWHNRTFLMAPYYERYCAGRTALTFISRSRDGQLISEVAAHFGIKAVRGSTSRHGVSAALAALHAAHDEKVDIVITPDGPRGPRYQLQPGILRIAQATQRPIVAITTNVRWKWILKSWDRFQVPLPFSRCELVTGAPLFVPENASPQELASLAARLGEALGGD